MLIRLFFLFAIIPIIELYILIKIGSHIGVLNTIIIVILTAAGGAYLAKMEGLRALFAIQKNISQGIMPTEELIDGVMILVAGIVLLTPGFLTDMFGIVILIPKTRQVIKIWLKHQFTVWRK